MRWPFGTSPDPKTSFVHFFCFLVLKDVFGLFILTMFLLHCKFMWVGLSLLCWFLLLSKPLFALLFLSCFCVLLVTFAICLPMRFLVIYFLQCFGVFVLEVVMFGCPFSKRHNRLFVSFSYQETKPAKLLNLAKVKECTIDPRRSIHHLSQPSVPPPPKLGVLRRAHFGLPLVRESGPKTW